MTEYLNHPTMVLVEPQIPPNTGNIARLCAANDIPLHLVGKLGFSMDDKQLKRAGMDYWQHVHWQHFPDVDAYFDRLTQPFYLFSSKAKVAFNRVDYPKNIHLVFGSETTGLPSSLMTKYADRCVTIPMKSKAPEIRCLNLSTCAGIGLYEALRSF